MAYNAKRMRVHFSVNLSLFPVHYDLPRKVTNSAGSLTCLPAIPNVVNVAINYFLLTSF